MKFYLAIGVGTLAILGLFGVTIAEMRTAQQQQILGDDASADDSEAALPSANDLPPFDARPANQGGVNGIRSAGSDPLSARETGATPALGLYIRPDGVTVGRVSRIDRNTLSLVPVADARVAFLQHRTIKAEAITDDRGEFAVSGLTPRAVYSVAVGSMDWVGMLSVAIRPFDEQNGAPVAPDDASVIGAVPGGINEIRFVSTNLADDEGQIQLIPREDFIVALRAGLFGSDVSGLPPASMYGQTTTGGGGGGGGGGAGGGGGSGLGGALLGAGAAAAIGAGAGNNQPASGFAP